MSRTKLELDGATFTRIAYAEAEVPAELLGLTAEVLAAHPWATPEWAEGDQLRVGIAAWFAEIGERVLVFDPLQAADAVLRPDAATEQRVQDGVERLLTGAGFAPERVDTVVLSHIDGLGMVARRDADGNWAPYFPNARVLMSTQELLLLDARLAVRGTDHALPEDADTAMVLDAYAALRASELIDGFDDGEALAPGLIAEASGGHGAGHAVLHYRGGDGSTRLSFLGHLALNPVHCATGPCEALNEDPPAAWRLLSKLLTESAVDRRTLVGPLWPAPGHGLWRGDRISTAT